MAVRIPDGLVCLSCSVALRDVKDAEPAARHGDSCYECGREWTVVNGHGAWHENNLSIMAKAVGP